MSLDINECSTSADACDVNAKCKNTVGSYTCTCKKGFTGNGKTCTGKINLTNCLVLPMQRKTIVFSWSSYQMTQHKLILLNGVSKTVTQFKLFNPVVKWL